MKSLILSLAITLTLASCSGTGNLSKREVISPGAPLNMPFRSDKTTLRAYNELSDTNPIDATNRNAVHCKAEIAATAFNAIEDCCITYVPNYPTKKGFIGHFSDDLIQTNLNDAVVVYNKITSSDDKSYTSTMTVELKKEKLLQQLKELFIENGIIPATDADALISAIDKAMVPQL